MQEIADASGGRARVVEATDDAEFWTLLGAAPGVQVAPAPPARPPAVDREQASKVGSYIYIYIYML